MKVSALIFACHEKACAPPPVGRGGSKPRKGWEPRRRTPYEVIGDTWVGTRKDGTERRTPYDLLAETWVGTRKDGTERRTPYDTLGDWIDDLRERRRKRRSVK